MIVCAICGEGIADPDQADQWTHAYRRRRKDGGGNAFRLAEPQQRFAHPTCVDIATARLKSKVAAEQEEFAWTE